MSGIIGGAGSKSGVIGETEIDYEEGTWTPTFTGTVGYSHGPYGLYTKIGDMVFCFVEMTISSWSGATNSYMSMPFTVSTSPVPWYSGLSVWYVSSAFTDTDKQLTGWEGSGLVLSKTGAGNNASAGPMNINVVGRMSFSFSYKTA